MYNKNETELQSTPEEEILLDYYAQKGIIPIIFVFSVKALQTSPSKAELEICLSSLPQKEYKAKGTVLCNKGPIETQLSALKKDIFKHIGETNIYKSFSYIVQDNKNMYLLCYASTEEQTNSIPELLTSLLAETIALYCDNSFKQPDSLTVKVTKVNNAPEAISKN